MARQQTLRRGRNLREPLTLGSLACLARAALEQHGKKAPLKVLGRSTRRALQGIPENARRLLAGALAGKVRGRLVAAAWAGEKLWNYGKGQGHVAL